MFLLHEGLTLTLSISMFYVTSHYVLYIPTVHVFGSVSLHTLLVQTHTHDVSAPDLNAVTIANNTELKNRN